MAGKSFQFLSKSKDREGLLPWVIGVMLFLCTLALHGAYSVKSGIDGWSSGLANNLTVQIVASDNTERDRQSQAALRLLRATPGIKSAEILATSDVIAMVSPWLGDIPIDGALPLPDLIDVVFEPETPVNIDALRERLQATAADASIDDHQMWLSQIIELASTAQIVMLAVAVMVVLCTIAVVVFGCRAGLATHAESIEIMHLMGAEDSIICRAFDLKYLRHGLVGGAIGTLAAWLVLWFVSDLAADIGGGIVSAALPANSGYVWFLLLPLATAGLTLITARITVQHALKEMM